MKNFRKIFVCLVLVLIVALPFVLVGCTKDQFTNAKKLTMNDDGLESSICAVEEGKTYTFKAVAPGEHEYSYFFVLPYSGKNLVGDELDGCLDSDEDKTGKYFTIAVYNAQKEKVEFSSFEWSCELIKKDNTLFTINAGETYYIVITTINVQEYLDSADGFRLILVKDI